MSFSLGGEHISIYSGIFIDLVSNTQHSLGFTNGVWFYARIMSRDFIIYGAPIASVSQKSLSLLFPTLDRVFFILNKSIYCCSSACTLWFLLAVIFTKRGMILSSKTMIHPNISGLCGKIIVLDMLQKQVLQGKGVRKSFHLSHYFNWLLIRLI